MQRITKRGINTFQLKIIALFCMTIDHLALFSINHFSSPLYLPMRIIGRIAAPLFLFLVVQGITYTSNKTKYVLRLYVIGVLIQAVNVFLDPYKDAGFGNILPTFMYTALYIVNIEKIVNSFKHKRWKHIIAPIFMILMTLGISIIYLYIDRNSFVGILLRIFFVSIFRIEYSFLFVLLGIMWYFIDNRVWNCLLFVVFCAICGLIDSSFIIELTPRFNFFELFSGIQWCMVLATPFIFLYNGCKGKSGKWFFYAYYPLHQYIIYALTHII